MLNKDHADFHKIIVTVNRFNGNYLPLVYVQYYFEGDEHEITSNQLFRGNNLQKGKPRQATNFSERQKIRELSKAGMKGKKVFRKIYADVGGFEKARTAVTCPICYVRYTTFHVRVFQNKTNLLNY